MFDYERTLNLSPDSSPVEPISKTAQAAIDLANDLKQPTASPAVADAPSAPSPEAAAAEPAAETSVAVEKATPFHEHPDWIAREQKHKAQVADYERRLDEERKQRESILNTVIATQRPELAAQLGIQPQQTPQAYFRELWRQKAQANPDDLSAAFGDFMAEMENRIDQRYLPKEAYLKERQQSEGERQYKDLTEKHPDFNSATEQQYADFSELYGPYVRSGRKSLAQAWSEYKQVVGAQAQVDTAVTRASEDKARLDATRQHGAVPQPTKTLETRDISPKKPNQVMLDSEKEWNRKFGR